MKNVLEWIKSNWILIIAGVAIVFLLWQRSVSADLLSSVLKSQQEQTQAHQQEIKDLEAINKAKNERLNKLVEIYRIDLEKMEKDYTLVLEQIKQKGSKHRKKITKEAKDNPRTLSDRITDTFFIPYYEGVQP